MKNLLLLLAMIILFSSCATYRTEPYRIKVGQTPAEAYKKHYNNEKRARYERR